MQALFTDAAMLKIQGQSKLLKVGQSHGGVTLVEATSSRAVLELGGERREVGVSGRISGKYLAPSTREVRIPRDAQMQYRAQAELNGRRLEVLVDTGANIVAMNSTQARRLGIDYRKGMPSRVETAAGLVNAWIVTLDSVNVGGIEVSGVRATVIEGTHPNTVLLGMSFLEHVEMREKNGILLLSRGY